MKHLHKIIMLLHMPLYPFHTSDPHDTEVLVIHEEDFKKLEDLAVYLRMQTDTQPSIHKNSEQQESPTDQTQPTQITQACTEYSTYKRDQTEDPHCSYCKKLHRKSRPIKRQKTTIPSLSQEQPPKETYALEIEAYFINKDQECEDLFRLTLTDGDHYEAFD